MPSPRFRSSSHSPRNSCSSVRMRWCAHFSIFTCSISRSISYLSSSSSPPPFFKRAVYCKRLANIVILRSVTRRASNNQLPPVWLVAPAAGPFNGFPDVMSLPIYLVFMPERRSDPSPPSRRPQISWPISLLKSPGQTWRMLSILQAELVAR